MAMQAGTTESSHAIAALEDQCRNWLLRIELDIHCSSVTLNAVQWALSALLAIQRSESLDAVIDSPDSSLDAAGESGPCEQTLGVSGTGPVLGPSIALLDINVSPDVGDMFVPHAGIGIDHSEAVGKVGEGAHGKSSDVGGELREKEEIGQFVKDVANCGDEAKLAEEIELADKGETGERLAAVINERLATPGCPSLVKLIEQCLLISLDQETPATIAIFLIDLKRPGDEGAWLHIWLLNSLLSSSKLDNSWKQRKNFSGCDLDWLLACLSAASPGLYLVLLIDLMAAECFHHQEGTNVALSLFVRTAAILEFVFLRYGEHAALLFLSSYQLFEKILNGAREERMQNFDKTYFRGQYCHSSFWLSLGTLCPRLFSCCICLLVPTLDIASVKMWWHLLQNWNPEELPLLDLSKVFLGTNSDVPKRQNDWLCALLRRRLAQLSPAAVDIVLLLDRLCNPFIDMELSKTAYLLLETLSQELSHNIFPTVSGLRTVVASGSVHVFMENLKLHVTRLWSSMMGNHVPLERQTSNASMRSVYDHPSVQICFLTLLSSDAQAVAEVLTDSAVLNYSTAEKDNLSNKLVLLVNVMRILAGTAETQLIFDLWGQRLVDRIQMQHSDKACTRIFALKKLLELSSMKDNSSSLSPQRLPKEGCESELELWLPAQHYLLEALNKHWMSLLPLLYLDEAWEMRLMVLDILQHLSPNKSSNYQEVVGRLKRALGLFLWWLDKAYGSHNNIECHQEGHLYLGLTWSKSDEKWQQVCLIEKIKGLIIELASSKLMSFTLMANSLLDYSFQGMQRLLPEASVPRKFSKVSPMFATCKSGRLNYYGRFEIPANKECRSSASHHFHQEIKRKGSKDDYLGVDRVDDFSQTTLVAAQLGNLLRRTLAQMSSQLEQPLKNEGLRSQPSTVLASLMVDRLQTPHEVSMTKEQYEEVLPKVISASRHIFLVNCFSKNPFLFEMLEIIVENGGESEASQCVEFIRTLLADSISSWHNRSHVHKYIPSTTMQIRDEEAARVQVFRLIQMITISGWLPKPLASSSEIVSLIDGEDMSDLLFLVWHCMHSCQENNVKCKSSVQVGTRDIAEVSANKDWEDQYFTILRKNVSKIGCHFSQVYPKGTT